MGIRPSSGVDSSFFGLVDHHERIVDELVGQLDFWEFLPSLARWRRVGTRIGLTHQQRRELVRPEGEYGVVRGDLNGRRSQAPNGRPGPAMVGRLLGVSDACSASIARTARLGSHVGGRARG